MLKKLNLLMCSVLIFQLIGCGTILYPERKGQKGGKIDVGVAILDGIGLLCFLIPGIIAFAVDFNNGTIYLPGTFSSLEKNNIKEVKFDPKHTSLAGIERIIKNETNLAVKLDQPNVQITKLESIEEMNKQFAQIMSTLKDDRLVLIH
jgi:hypothetical protein